MEEEPFSNCYKDFIGKGPFAAVLLAKSGKRPAMSATAIEANKIICDCWEADAALRPTFALIVAQVTSPTFSIPNSFC